MKIVSFSDLTTENPKRMVNYKGKTGTKIFARTQTIKIILTTKKLKVGRNILAIENSFELLLPLLSLYFSYSWNEKNSGALFVCFLQPQQVRQKSVNYSFVIQIFVICTTFRQGFFFLKWSQLFVFYFYSIF